MIRVSSLPGLFEAWSSAKFASLATERCPASGKTCAGPSASADGATNAMAIAEKPGTRGRIHRSLQHRKPTSYDRKDPGWTPFTNPQDGCFSPKQPDQ